MNALRCRCLNRIHSSNCAWKPSCPYSMLACVVRLPANDHPRASEYDCCAHYCIINICVGLYRTCQWLCDCIMAPVSARRWEYLTPESCRRTKSRNTQTDAINCRIRFSQTRGCVSAADFKLIYSQYNFLCTAACLKWPFHLRHFKH